MPVHGACYQKEKIPERKISFSIAQYCCYTKIKFWRECNKQRYFYPPKGFKYKSPHAYTLFWGETQGLTGNTRFLLINEETGIGYFAHLVKLPLPT
jgi:hypothetical protein